jgi:hypothetical protein
MIVYEFDTVDDLIEAIEMFNSEVKIFEELLSSKDIDSLKEFISDIKAFVDYAKNASINHFMTIFELDPEKFQYLRFMYGVVTGQKKFFEKLFMEFFKKSKNEYLEQNILTVNEIDTDFDTEDLSSATIFHKFFYLIGEPDEYFRHLLNVKVNSYMEWLKGLDKISATLKYLNVYFADRDQSDYGYFLTFYFIIERHEYKFFVPIRINASIAQC